MLDMSILSCLYCDC